jgi:hypothetical protein
MPSKTGCLEEGRLCALHDRLTVALHVYWVLSGNASLRCPPGELYEISGEDYSLFFGELP